MNVLMLAPDFIPCWGGVGTYISEIAKNLPGDVEVHILTPLRTQFENNLIESHNELNYHFPSNVHIYYTGIAKNNFLYNLDFQINCYRILQKFVEKYNIDIIHSQSAMPDLFLSPRRVKIPIITTIHTTIEGQLNIINKTYNSFNNLDSSEKAIYLFGPLLKYVENYYYNQDRHYITVSQWGKKSIVTEKKIDPNNITVIHNGVDSSIFTPQNKKRADIYFPEFDDPDSLKILYLSRLIYYKGIHCLIRSIPKILRAIDAHFIIAGAGKPILIDPSFNSNCSYLGYIPHDRKPFLYSCADIFILPSFYENFPISILESMASQNSVIATNVGGIPEMIQPFKNGLLIPPNDPDSIAHAIIKLGEDTALRENLARNARNFVIEKFNWRIAAEKTKNYYEKVLEK